MKLLQFLLCVILCVCVSVNFRMLSSPGLRWAWCWWGGPPPDVPTEIPESPTTERWCGRKSLRGSYTEDKDGGSEKKTRETKGERQKVIGIGFGSWGMLWPSWRRWNRHHFIRLFHITSPIALSHKPFPGHSLSTGMPARRLRRSSGACTSKPATPAWYLVKFAELTFYLLPSFVLKKWLQTALWV